MRRPSPASPEVARISSLSTASGGTGAAPHRIRQWNLSSRLRQRNAPADEANQCCSIIAAWPHMQQRRRGQGCRLRRRRGVYRHQRVAGLVAICAVTARLAVQLGHATPAAGSVKRLNPDIGCQRLREFSDRLQHEIKEMMGGVWALTHRKRYATGSCCGALQRLELSILGNQARGGE